MRYSNMHPGLKALISLLCLIVMSLMQKIDAPWAEYASYILLALSVCIMLSAAVQNIRGK